MVSQRHPLVIRAVAGKQAGPRSLKKHLGVKAKAKSTVWWHMPVIPVLGAGAWGVQCQLGLNGDTSSQKKQSETTEESTWLLFFLFMSVSNTLLSI